MIYKQKKPNFFPFGTNFLGIKTKSVSESLAPMEIE